MCADRYRRAGVVLAAALFALAATAECAPGATVMHMSDFDLEFTLLEPSITGVAAGTVSGGSSSDGSLSVAPALGPGGRTQHAFTWRNGTEEPFVLVYDPASARLTLALGGAFMQCATRSPGTDLFVRAYAAGSGAAVLVSELELDGVPLGGVAGANGEPAADVLWIGAGGLANGFTLTGNVRIAWDGDLAPDGPLGFQIIVGTAGAPVSVRLETWGRLKAAAATSANL